MITKLIGAAIVAAGVYTFAGPDSGLAVGESVTPFHPTHVTGPDKGTDTCPPCKYGNRPAVQVWVNGDSERNVTKIARKLNEWVASNKEAELKGFVIFLVDEPNQKAEQMIRDLAQANSLGNIGMAWLKKTDDAVKNYKVNLSGDVKNTIFVYKNKKVVQKFVNLEATEEGLNNFGQAVMTAVK